MTGSAEHQDARTSKTQSHLHVRAAGQGQVQREYLGGTNPVLENPRGLPGGGDIQTVT